MTDTSSPEHRAACEARHVAAMPTLERRREHLALVEKMRGKAGRLELEEAIRAEWDRRKNRSARA